MILLQAASAVLKASAEFNFWKDAFPVLVTAAGFTITGVYLKYKIDALNGHIAALKGQVEAQQGILNSAKTLVEIINLDKIKGYAEMREDQATRETKALYEEEIKSLKKESQSKDEERQKSLENAGGDLQTKLNILEKALQEEKEGKNKLQIIVDRFHESGLSPTPETYPLFLGQDVVAKLKKDADIFQKFILRIQHNDDDGKLDAIRNYINAVYFDESIESMKQQKISFDALPDYRKDLVTLIVHEKLKPYFGFAQYNKY
ncbi:hypothetical protein [Hymenobacter sp.]|jgi:hypothetical protein|uniref:hypothetical protein n=1 Tax=Hymenobacter sp. TaxID=1898978 RepID=UPI002ED7F7F2